MHVHCKFYTGNRLVAGGINDVGCNALTWVIIYLYFPVHLLSVQLLLSILCFC